MLIACWLTTFETPSSLVFFDFIIFGTLSLSIMFAVAEWIAPHYIRQALIIDKDGIWDSRATRDPILWSDIRAISPKLHAGDGFYTLRNLIRVDLYADARRRMSRSWWRFIVPICRMCGGWDAVLLSTADTNLSFDDLCREVKTRAGPLWRDHG